ncbi:hypothetical protein ACB098_10G132100 [Castanea mollissima]
MMNNLKLGVDVVSAHNLLPKDGLGSSSAFVELYFDGQKFRTTIKEKDLNPVWNESFYFNISDPSNLHYLTLDAYIYNNVKATNSRSFLGKISLTGTSFVPYSDAVVLHYPLEKRGLFSRVRGELGLKVYITDDPTIKSSIPIPATESLPSKEPSVTNAQAQTVPNAATNTHKVETRHTFHHLPNSTHHHHHQSSASAAPSPITAGVPQHGTKYEFDEMKVESQPPKVVRMYSASSSQPAEYALKETSPFLGGGRVVGGRVIHGDKTASTYDLVEKMHFLYVRVVKARDLPAMDVTGSLDPYVEVKIGNYKGITKHFEKQQNPVWNQVFAFSKDRTQASVLEVVIKDKDLVKDDFVGIVRFDINEVPLRVPPDSPLAPEWYRLGDKKGEKIKGELMLAVWIGTQADEAFSDAWHSDAAMPIDSTPAISAAIRSKVYHAPRLWYVRVNVIEAQDLVPTEKNRFPDVYVKAQIGNQVLKTKNVQARTLCSLWNEDLLFVAAEPFEDHLVISVEDRVGPGKDEIIGRVIIPLSSVDKRADDRMIHSRWFNLEKPIALDVDQLKKEKFYSRLHLRVSLDGGYHVLDESTHYSSDLRPTAKQLWKPPIGVLELGILNAVGLHPMKTRDGRGTSDTYCVAKYGHKWVRTRTIVDNLSPKYNEQYTWEVFDPATVITIGVFDNSLLGEKGSNGNKDLKIGKVDMLRHQAVHIVAARLGRAEPPLRKEVLEYMSDIDSHLWSMRRSKAHFFRLMTVFSGLFAVGKWFGDICLWRNPITTVLVHVLFLMLVCFPELILPTAFLYMFLIGVWNFRYRPRYPPHMNTKLSQAEAVLSDELDEEFDSFPTSRSPDVVRMRYDRLRSVAGRIQTVVGDVATQGERLQNLLSWRDPRATAIFITFCLVAALVLYVTPFQAVAALAGFYVLRHPRFRHKSPSVPINFFRRLPARTDSMLKCGMVGLAVSGINQLPNDSLPKMAVSVSKKKSKQAKKVEAREICFSYSILINFFYQIPAAVFLLILIFLWSSSTTIISGKIIHVCVSSRKLNNLYCLSAGTQPNFDIPIPVINNNIREVEKGRDEEIAHAKKVVEEQMQLHRSWKSSKNHPVCDGRGIYVYDLPSKFNTDLVGQCHDLVPWADFCEYFNNDALGQPIPKLGKGWYQTHQYSLEPIFHTRVLKHPCRVYNENEAKLFYVPFYGGLDILRWNFKNVSNDVKDTLPLELIKWLEKQQPWVRNAGKDHVFVLGKISWDFRRYDNSPWGTRFLELSQMQNPIKLLIERQPWHVNDIGIPHPTFFHPRSDDDIISWQLKIISSSRKSLVSFAGAPRPDQPDNIRSILINLCNSAENGMCRFMNCSSGGCDQPESVIELFKESEFCLQPPGDSPTRKSVFDSLVSGCIPVFFCPFTAYYQYPWHLSADHGKYSVFIDQEEVKQRKVNVVERLMKISPRKREDMRSFIIYEVLPGLVYGDSNSQLEKFQDAFSIAMNNLLERVTRMESNAQ